LIHKNPEDDQELERLIIEFEAWCRSNGSNDLDAFVKDRPLAPEVVEELKRCQEMEEELSSLVGRAEFKSNFGERSGPTNRTIGNYQLQELLGVGGMGAVWLARQSHPMNRKVAIKLIRSDRDSSVTDERFEREKQALALMSHAHVAQVYEAGTSEDGRSYIAMEYVDGETITDYCKNRQSTLTVRLELFLQLCSAIQHAHQVGLLHRDIKPDNILVTEVDGKPTVKVIDFGLVRTSDTWNPQITEPDMIVGSPLWMSPEQAGGSQNAASNNSTAKTVDARTDVYSLGVILYQLLTDTTPITKECYKQSTKFDLLNTIHNEVPELPSARVGKSGFVEGNTSTPVSSWGNVLRNELDWVTMRALEKECDRRYATVASFAEDVRNYLQNEPVTARPPSFSYRVKKLTQRHKAATLAGVVICGLIVISTAGIWWFSNEASINAVNAESAEAVAVEAKAVAVKAKAVAKIEKQRRDKLLKHLAQQLKKYNPTADGEIFEEWHLEILDEYRDFVDDGDYSDDPLWEAKYRQLLGDAYSGSAENASAITQYEKVVKLYSDAPDSNPKLLIAAKLKLAEEHSLHSVDDKALPIARECLDESEEQFGENDELTIASRIQTNRSSLPFGNTNVITADMKKTVELAKRELGESHPVTIKATTAMGVAYETTHNQVAAAEQIEMALELAKDHFGLNDRRTMELRIRKLEIAGRTGTLDSESREDLDALFKEYNRKFGPEHLFTVRLRIGKANLAITDGHFESAISQLGELITDCGREFGKTHPATTMNSRDLLGFAYFKRAIVRKRSDKFSDWIKKAYEIRTEMIDDYETMNLSESGIALKARSALASVLYRMASIQHGDAIGQSLEQALRITERFLPKSDELLGRYSNTSLSFHETQFACLASLGHREEALKLGTELYLKSREDLDQPSVTTASAASSLAEYYVHLDRREDARKYYEINHELSVELHSSSGHAAQRSLAFLFNEQACLGEHKSAESNARKAIEHMSDEMAERFRIMRAAEVTIGESLCEQGRFDEGKRYLEKALDALKSSDRRTSLQRLFELRAQSALALCEMADGRESDAIATLKSALAGMKELEKATPVRYRWFTDRCKERLAKLENADANN